MNALQLLQDNSGVNPDGQFGPKTFAATAAFLGITEHSHAVHFFAQCAHESAGFTMFEESLNYSTSRLLSTFGRYFKNHDEAAMYARNPEKIANRVYANRMGNGDEDSGDGWRYKGRGAIQLTGRDNYGAYSNSEGRLLILETEALSNELAFDAAMWFFDHNNLWKYCDHLNNDNIKNVTRRINGGYNGLDDRIRLTGKYSNYSL